MKFPSINICTLLIIVYCGNFRYCYANTFSEKYSPYRNEKYSPSKNDPLGLEMVNYDPPLPGWKNPYDMTGKGGHLSSDSELITQNEVEMDHLKKRLEESQIFLRRIVNVFLHGIGIKGEPRDFPTRYFRLELLISGDEMKTLQNYGQNKGNVGMGDASRVLQKIFSQNLHQNDHSSTIFTRSWKWLSRVSMKIIQSPEVTVVSCTLLMVLATVITVYRTHSFRMGFFFLFITVFFASCGITWMKMYEEEEVKKFVTNQMYKQAPYHCTGNYMPWYEHMYYRMFGIDCYEFYNIRDIRSAVKVSPSDVLAHTFSSMFIMPMTNIGIAYGSFVKSVMAHVPWYLKPIAMPLSFLAPLVFVIIGLALLCNYRLSLSITGFHMIPTWCAQRSLIEDQYIQDLSYRPKKDVSHGDSLQMIDSNRRNKTRTVASETSKCEDKQISTCKESKGRESSQTKIKASHASKGISNSEDDVSTSEDEHSSDTEKEHEPYKRKTSSSVSKNVSPQSPGGTSVTSADMGGSGDNNSSTDAVAKKQS